VDLQDPRTRAVSAALRTDPALWRALVMGSDPDVGSAGCLALELIMVLLTDGSASVLRSPTDMAAVAADATRHLVLKQGIPPGAAMTLARSAVCIMAASNQSTLASLARVLTSMREPAAPRAADDGGHAHGHHRPVHSMVLRLSLRSVNDMAANDAMGTAWFRSSHANALVVFGDRAVLLDPAAPRPLPAIFLCLHTALERLRVPLLTHAVDHWSPVADLSLCTLGAGVMALMVLANASHMHDETAVNTLVTWVHSRQHWLLRALVTAACTQLNPTGPEASLWPCEPTHPP
jgi:hypothetical protein